MIKLEDDAFDQIKVDLDHLWNECEQSVGRYTAPKTTEIPPYWK